MSDSQTGWLGPEMNEEPKESRLSRPLAVLIILAASTTLWVLLVLGLAGF
jgi:hypothetical protein